MENSIMKKFVDQLEENIKLFPDRIAVKSAAKIKGISFSELNEYSSKVYSYLVEHGIGCEDMVLICLPRGIRTVVSLVGIIKAGAAFTIVENTYSPERIKFIEKDCNCKFVIDEDHYAKMMDCKPLDGHKTTDPHDAAFAVYTSGSTGNPKGVLHEYGKLEQAVCGVADNTEQTSQGNVFLSIAPLNFVASVWFILYTLYFGKCLYILSYDVAKNANKLVETIIKEKAEELFMPASFLKTFEKLPDCVVNVITGGEPCNNVFVPNVHIINKYGSSESGMMITSFVLDKKYEKAPVGKNGYGIDVFISDDGHQVEDGEQGEICFKNEYTRGYINLPEKTSEVFVNGIYYMGDLGYKDNNGNIVISGRKDDMIKINGNRIEPAEIEGALMHVLGIKNAIAKGFIDDTRAYICAYFIRSELEEKNLLDENGELKTPIDVISKDLLTRIPYYMIPTYYVVVEEYPHNKNGKIAKKELKAPEIKISNQNYISPRNENEEYFCKLFEKVLKVENVGIKDDFYLIGGDSISSLKLITECQYKEITAADIYKLRTPEKLAEYYSDKYLDNDDSKDIEERNAKALKHSQHLLPEMMSFLDFYFIMPNSTMWNLPFLFKLKDEIDVKRLASAVNKVLRSHPAFATKIEVNIDSVFEQKYYPDSYQDIEIEHISEDEFNNIIPTLCYPFKVVDTVLHRKKIYITEKAKYLFIDIHHLIVDGTSVNIILSQIEECYKDIDAKLPTDYYYLILRDCEKAFSKDDFAEEKKLYLKKLSELKQDSYSILPKTDFESNKWEKGWFSHKLSINKKDLNNSKIFEIVQENAFFISALALTMSVFNHTKNVALQWTYNDRSDYIKMNSIGLLFKSLQIFGIHNDEKTIKEYLCEIKDLINFEITHSLLPSSDVIGNEFSDTVYFLYQKNLFNMEQYEFVDKSLPIKGKNEASDSYMEFSIVDNDDESDYECTIKYSNSHYKNSSIEEFFKIYDSVVNKIIKINDIDNIKLKDILGEK